MFFNNYKKIHGGDILTHEYLEETAKKITFLKETRKDLLNKTKQILRKKRIPCNNINTFKELTEEINKYNFEKRKRSSRFDGNVIDLRDEIKDGEILVMAKAGQNVKFNVTTYMGEKYIVEWQENGITQKSIQNNDSTFSKTVPSTGISSVDESFKYTIYKIYSSGVINKFYMPYSTGGEAVIWIISKGINFDSVVLNNSTTNENYPYKNLEYFDILDGGSNAFRANGCINLIEVEADYIHIDNSTTGQRLFYNCKKLKKLPTNMFLKCYSFNYAFYNCVELLELPNIDLSYSIDNVCAFANCKSITNFKDNILKINKNSNCTDIASGCISLLEIPNITYGDEELGEGNNFTNAFLNCSNATKISPSLDLSYCRLGVSSMFKGCSNIIDGPSEILLYNNLNDKVRYNTNAMFQNCITLRSITSTITSANVISCNEMFRGCSSLKKAPRCTFPNTLTCDSMYRECSTLITPPDILDFPNAISSTYMFAECNLLQSAPATINLKSSLTNIYMFNNCKSLINGPTIINIESSFDNTYMFNNCSSLINFGEENVAIKFNDYSNNTYMFNNCSSLKTICDITGGYIFTNMFNACGLEKHPSINTISFAADFSSMFNKNLITSVDFDKINAPYARNFNNMFDYCPIEGNLIIDLSKFAKVLFCDYMFRGSEITDINITFPENTSQITQTFSNCLNLRSAIVNIPSKNAHIDNIFFGCNSIQSITISGLFKTVAQFSNFTSIFLKTLNINAPNWEIHTDNNNKLDKFTALEVCNINININNVSNIRNNKKLTDMNLTLNYDEGLKNNVVIYLDNNAFTEEVLNKIMTNLPNINLIEKKYEDLTAEIRIGNNPGTATCDTTIATDKGWTVYTS